MNPDRIVDCQVLLVSGAGAEFESTLEAIKHSLQESGLHERATWVVKAIRFSWWPFATASEHLVVRHDRLRDIELLVGAREYGAHLELTLLTALTPAWLKRHLASIACRGEWWAWSRPRGIAQEQEFQSFVAVVQSCVHEVAKAFAKQYASSVTSSSRRGSDWLAWW